MKSKLGIKLRDEELAAKLYAAGITNPAKLRKATDAELLKIPGIGAASVATIRKRVKVH